MGILSFFTGEDTKREKGTDETSSDLLSTLNSEGSNNFDRSYLDKKLLFLQEEKRLWEYEQNFVPAYHFEEEGLFQKFKEHIENTWRNILIALLFLVKGRNGAEWSEDEFTDLQIMDAVEQLSPGIEKTVATNLLKKMEAQKEVIDDKDTIGDLAIIKLLSIEENALRENLEMLVEADKGLCHPRELQVNHRDPARQEFAIYRQQLQDRKTLLQSILTNYHQYIHFTQKIYEAERQMSSETEESVTNSVMSVFSPVNHEGTFAFKLEKQQLENDIQKALTNLLDNKASLAGDIQSYKWQRLCHLVEICNLQWSRLPGNAIEYTDKEKKLYDLVVLSNNGSATIRDYIKKNCHIFQRYVHFAPSIAGVSTSPFTLYSVELDGSSNSVKIVEKSQEDLLNRTKNISRDERMKLVDFFVRGGKNPINTFYLHLPESVVEWKVNAYERLQSYFVVDSVLPIKFSDGSEGTLEDVRFKLDQWVDQYVSYNHLPDGLHGSFISIDHPKWGYRSSYAVSKDDVESTIDSFQSIKRDALYWSVDTKSLEGITPGIDMIVRQDLPDYIVENLYGHGSKTIRKLNISKFLLKYLSAYGIQPALAKIDTLHQLIEFISSEIGLVNANNTRSNMCLSAFIIAYVLNIGKVHIIEPGKITMQGVYGDNVRHPGIDERDFHFLWREESEEDAKYLANESRRKVDGASSSSVK